MHQGAGRTKCGLTPRSTGAPTAGHQARTGGTRYIFASPGLASHRRCPVSSNVRPHETHIAPGRGSECQRNLCTCPAGLRPIRGSRLDNRSSAGLHDRVVARAFRHAYPNSSVQCGRRVKRAPCGVHLDANTFIARLPLHRARLFASRNREGALGGSP